MRALSYLRAEKITFPDRHKDRRTEISVYRVASLLKRVKQSHFLFKEPSHKIFIKTHWAKPNKNKCTLFLVNRL